MSAEMYERIVALYGEQILKRSAMRIRQGAGVFERVLAGRGYRTALEIGTYRGASAAEMSRYVDRVITIDLKHGQLERVGDDWDRRAFWESLGVQNVEFHAVSGDREKALLVKSLDFDFAFIDGAHDGFGVRLDFGLTRRCGRVLFHDADDNGPDRANHVYEFIATLPKDQVQFMDIFALWRDPAIADIHDDGGKLL